MSDTSRKPGASALKERPVNSDGIPAPDNPTYEEFLDWADEDTYAEWVNGEVVALNLPTFRHQRICNFLSFIISFYSTDYDLGIVIAAPFQMRLSHSGRTPDLMFVNSNRSRFLQPDDIYLNDPADIVVEVVSPESVERDLVTKFAEYAAGGVPEYWIINAVSDEAHFYRLNEAGNYVEMGLDGNGRYYPPGLPGFWLNPAWLWQNPLPKPKYILRLIEGGS